MSTDTCCPVCGDGVPGSGPTHQTVWEVCPDCLAEGYTGAPGDDVHRATNPPPLTDALMDLPSAPPVPTIHTPESVMAALVAMDPTRSWIVTDYLQSTVLPSGRRTEDHRRRCSVLPGYDGREAQCWMNFTTWQECLDAAREAFEKSKEVSE